MITRTLRTAPLLAALALLGACTTPASGLKSGEKPPITPTERYKLEAEQAPDQIALGLHPDGLSEHQRAALADYARGYIEAGGEEMTIRAPAQGGEAAQRMAEATKAALEAAGLHEGELRLEAYAADKPNAPILVAYDRWRAKPLACGRSWQNLTATRDNQTQSNFGCAVTANMAAQIADPRDIRAPHAADPVDAARRGEVLGKYRKGEITSSQADDKMKGNVTQEVQ
jgi:pilus assembly protein CpaD